MTRSRVFLFAAVMVAALVGAAPLHAQDGGVGGLRLVDDAGETMGQEPAPPGEKLFRLDAGVQQFTVAFDVEGGTSDVQLRVMGPSGAVLFQETQTYTTPGTYTMDFDNGDVAFPEQDYVVNAYIGPEFYLADSLQMVVGAAQIPGSDSEEPVVVSADQQTTTDQGAGHELIAEPIEASQPLDATALEIPGGPSRQVLLVAGFGILVLLAIVVWAGWSALNRA
ncbi:MAG: hypothetical protein ACK2T6_02510 [Anaerolineae bacterium]